MGILAESDKAFIGIEACGCVTAAMTTGHASKREEQAELKRWMKTGRRVELTTVAEARKSQNFLDCPHQRAPSAPDEINAAAEQLVLKARSLDAAEGEGKP